MSRGVKVWETMREKEPRGGTKCGETGSWMLIIELGNNGEEKR